jgi:hypothetical protein
MPYIARKTGSTVIGTESTINLARAGGVPESQLLAVHGGEDWAFGDFSVKVIPSLHSALNGKHFFDSRVVPRDFRGPRRLGTDVEGGTLAYLLRLAGWEILWFGSGTGHTTLEALKRLPHTTLHLIEAGCHSMP